MGANPWSAGDCVAEVAMKLLVIATMIALLVTASGARAGQEETVVSMDDPVRKFAVCSCLAESYKGSELAADALKAAGGYFETGIFAAELYIAVQTFAENWAREKKYRSKHGFDLSIMKCLDLYHSKELSVLIQQAR